MWAKLLLLFFVFSFLFRTDHSFDQDLGRHIKLGEIIWLAKEVPKTNLFSYTNPDFQFINTHWLFEVLAYLFSGALPLFLILKIVIFLLSTWLILKNIKSAILLPVGFIFMHTLRERLELRPEVFSFLFTAITLYILEKKKRLFLLPIIQLIWINIHIYFFIGLILQTIYLVHQRTKLLTTILGISVLVSLINPNGLNGFLYPLNVSKNYGYTIVENQTMFLLENIKFSDPNFLFVKLSVGIVALSILVAFFRKQFGIKNILLALSGAVLALLNVRSFPYLIFLSLPATLANFGQIKKNGLFSFLSLVTCVLLLLESFFYLNGDYYKYRDDNDQVGIQFTENVKGGMDFVLIQNLPGPIYNNFDIGSYILYRGYPKYKVFVDGRPEAYPKEFFLETYIPGQSDYLKFKEQERKFGFRTIIFSHTDQTPWAKTFLQAVFKDPEWKLVYIDNFMLVLAKENLPVVDLSKLSPNQFNFSNHRDYLQLGLFLFSQNQASGKLFIEKALQLFPNSPIANTISGNPTSNIFFW